MHQKKGKNGKTVNFLTNGRIIKKHLMILDFILPQGFVVILFLIANTGLLDIPNKIFFIPVLSLHYIYVLGASLK